MCHNFHIRGSSCLFFVKNKVQWRKNNLQRLLLQGDQIEKKRHKEERKNGHCHTNEKKGK